MKKFIGKMLVEMTVVFSLLLVPVMAFASPLADLQLTDTQINSAKAIIRQANEKIMTIAADNQNVSPFQLRSELKEIHSIRAEAMQKIRVQLTSDQQAVFDQWAERMRQHKESKRQMLQQLNLTRQQRIQFAKITENSQEAAWRIIGNSATTPEDIRQQLTMLHEKTAQLLRQQLTAEQQTQFDVWKKNNRQPDL